MVDKKLQGKKNRASGADFERRVRADLNNKGWVVDKWSNNIEWYFETEDVMKQENPIGRIAPAKRKYLGPGRPMVIGTGFPDFSCHRKVLHGETGIGGGSIIEPKTAADTWQTGYDVIGVECKTNGNLDKIEREKCIWMLENNTFSKILIASKTKVKNRVVITYVDFEKKYGSVIRK